ncbi:unnamed protein product [Pleuronectes platessa]|uniref:Uncharacterized protein n=1 Tax=Pleuronectes platessa TaxID=8262 RepID=A0A9N7TM53_PLEPL|nr:unnamed protein product [Pleuronectes platessa]
MSKKCQERTGGGLRTGSARRKMVSRSPARASVSVSVLGATMMLYRPLLLFVYILTLLMGVPANILAFCTFCHKANPTMTSHLRM